MNQGRWLRILSLLVVPVACYAAAAAFLTPHVLAEPGTDRSAAPYFLQEHGYSMLDIVAIFLRQGMEALLLLIALFGFLSKTGNREKYRWVWRGAFWGAAASVVLLIAVRLIVPSLLPDESRFRSAGYAGILAAVLIFYMSFWMRSKSGFANWQQYISHQSTNALRSGRMLALSTLAFIAVFREGAEASLLFVGLAPEISWRTLLQGIVVGMVLLSALGYLFLTGGKKVPLRPFFRLSAMLAFYLCFKFVGMGIHNLQLAGVMQATPLESLQDVSFLGWFATWESAVPQMALVFVTAAAGIWSRRRDIRLKKQLNL